MQKTKILETSLVLTTGFLILYIISSKAIFLYLALVFGIIGIFVKPLAKIIAIAWFKLADILSYIVSKVILGALFFLILLPISMIYKIFNKDKLQIKRTKKTNWVERNQTYSLVDLENIW